MGVTRIERELTDVPATLARAKAESEKFFSTWDGDAEGGRYVLRTPLGTIRGTYTVENEKATFLVEKKPRIIPWALIERVLDQFLAAS